MLNIPKSALQAKITSIYGLLRVHSVARDTLLTDTYLLIL